MADKLVASWVRQSIQELCEDRLRRRFVVATEIAVRVLSFGWAGVMFLSRRGAARA
jgi:hypothetical protein